MIHVIAVITANPGKREEILRHFRANVPAVRAEKGCIEYGAALDAENAPPFQAKWGPDTFLVVEVRTFAMRPSAQSGRPQARILTPCPLLWPRGAP